MAIQPAGPARLSPTPGAAAPALAPQSPSQDDRPTRVSGEVVYLTAFDIAYDMARVPVSQLLGQPVAHFAVDTSRQGPPQMFFYRPQMVRLPALERIGPHGPLRIERTVKLFPVGAVSVSLRSKFQNLSLDDLVAYHDLKLSTGPLETEAWQIAEQVRLELEPYLVRPVPRLVDCEIYTVFAITTPTLGPAPAAGAATNRGDGDPSRSRFDAEVWLARHRRSVAGLLTQEPDAAALSEQEMLESTGRFLSYYSRDLAVIDWDAALVIDEPRNFDEVLHVMELANVQLVELQAYDRLLDEQLQRSYRDLGSGRYGKRRDVMRGLREIRLDLARLSDELFNITKFFGDWHLARVYQALGSRFHLEDWRDAIDGKLKTLGEHYELLNHERSNRIMVWLEAAIVLLFIVDLLAIFFFSGH